MDFLHKPVLFDEAIASLHIQPDGIYVDGTAGGAGHSRAIAQKLGRNGKLISIDRDPDAVKVVKERLAEYPMAVVVQSEFSRLDEVLDDLGIDKIDGMLLDLGVSSHQLDTAQRGFSFHQDAPLDMRMSQIGLTAADLVNTLSEKELSDIIFSYGEERYARSIARNICRVRENAPIQTTGELAELIKSSMPAAARRDGHPARRTFQALRIAVNGELDQLADVMNIAFDRLSVGGRLSIITFHSLEDRMVKQKFNKWCKGCTCPPDFPVCVCGNSPRASLPVKNCAPTQNELEQNPRSHSARLRVAEKLRD